MSRLWNWKSEPHCDEDVRIMHRAFERGRGNTLAGMLVSECRDKRLMAEWEWNKYDIVLTKELEEQYG